MYIVLIIYTMVLFAFSSFICQSVQSTDISLQGLSPGVMQVEQEAGGIESIKSSLGSGSWIETIFR